MKKGRVLQPGQVHLAVKDESRSGVVVGNGYMLPESFTVESKSADGTTVTILAEWADGRVRARRVTVEREPDVTSTTLREVTIREDVAAGVRLLLKRIEWSGDRGHAVSIGDSPSQDELALIGTLVGYVEVKS